MTTGDAAVTQRGGGVVIGMNDVAYRKDTAISYSSLKLLSQNPAKYKYVILDKNPIEQTPAMRLGSAFDSALLTPLEFEARYAVSPEGIRRGTKAWEEFETGAAGKEILKPDEYAQIIEMRQAVMRHSVASQILSGGQSQASLFWVDPVTGVSCKGRMDYLRSDGIIVDVKTTTDGNAAAEQFQRTCFSLGYHRQAAWYSDGLGYCGTYSPAFLFIVVEKEPPYGVAIYSMDPEFIELGRQAYQRDLAVYAECLRENVWPGYTQEIQPLAPPAWAYKKGTQYA